MRSWHLTDDGPRPCSATVRPCPLGGEHYDTLTEAEEVYGSRFQKLSTVSRSTVRPPRLETTVPLDQVTSWSEQQLKDAGLVVLAPGSRSVAILDEKNGVVLKWRRDGSVKELQEEHASYLQYLDKVEDYARLGVRYAETEYRTVGDRIVVVQEYVHPVKNMPYELYDDPREDRVAFFDQVREDEIDRTYGPTTEDGRPTFADVTWHDMFVEPDGTVVLVDALYDGVDD